MIYKLILADDHTILRSGLHALLSLEREYIVTKEIGDGQEIVSACVEFQPNLIIMDLSMPHMNGIDTIKKIKQHCPGVKVLILTAHKEVGYVRMSIAAGAEGYTLKDDTYESLLVAMRTILNGKTYISPSIPYEIASEHRDQASKSALKSPWDHLTRREYEVLKMVAEGLKTREIAVKLSLSPKTIENHRANLMSKLNFKNSPALVCYAVEHGLL